MSSNSLAKLVKLGALILAQTWRNGDGSQCFLYSSPSSPRCDTMIHQFSPVQLLMTTSIAEITLRNSSSSSSNKTRSICFLHWLWVVVAWSWNPQTLHQPRRKVSAVITTTTANDPLPKAFKRKAQNKVHLRRQQLAKIMNCNLVEMRQKILKNIQNIRSQMDGLTEEEADVMVTALSLEVVALKRVNSKDATQQQNFRSTSSIRRNQKVRSRNNNRSPSVQRTSPGRPYCNETLQWPKRWKSQ